ncbi:MAG TPA: tail fiber domain-containing protein, partial [Chitinophagaceae bacterium]|nr:tail fiber domain-containing protein [Chitinophagaceae bacterium]
NGVAALQFNTTGDFNTAAGSQSLQFNTTGESNTAFGSFSLNHNTEGIGNTAAGSGSLFQNTTGSVNTAMGDLSLNSNITGRSNTAVGVQSLFLNFNGNSNTAVGGNALSATTGSSSNTVVGFNAAFSFNMGSSNTIVGANADADKDGITNSTAIGAGAIVNASNKVRIGNGAVTVIEGQVPFTTPSDGRFKFNIKEDVKGLDFIMKLHPVTYQFDVKRFDEQWNNTLADTTSNVMLASYNEATAIRRTGFIAQEVEKAATAAAYNFSGIIKPETSEGHYSLSYESFVVPLVKAMQEQQRMIEELKKQNADLQKRILVLEKK